MVFLEGAGAIIFLLVSILPMVIAGYLSYQCNKYTPGIKKWIFILGAAVLWPTYLPYYVTNHMILTDYAFCGDTSWIQKVKAM